jgi:hypothetical protein
MWRVLLTIGPYHYLYNLLKDTRPPTDNQVNKPAAGGKDGFPFPVDRELYDRNIGTLEEVVRRARINPNEKDHALRRLQRWLDVMF